MPRARKQAVPTSPPSTRVPRDADLLAIDPGVEHPAAARFLGGKLIAAARTFVDPSWKRLGIGQRGLLLAGAVVAWEAERARFFERCKLTHVIVEWPQVYSETHAGGVDPNDLTKILGMAMAAVGLLEAYYPGLQVLSPVPRDVWAQLPKAKTGDPWLSKRGERIRGRLSDDEIAAVVPSHDAIDAVGLGLWCLGRFEPYRVFPGAT